MTSISSGNLTPTFANAITDQVSFVSYDDRFASDILGDNVTQETIAEVNWEAFHEAGVYNIATERLYATSAWAGSFDDPINVTAIDTEQTDEILSLRYAHLAQPNGGTAYYPIGSPPTSSEGQTIVFCDQGNYWNPSQLVAVDPASNFSQVLVDNFFGRNFSSINDVKQHYYTGDLWFTDAPYGYWQGFRPQPAIRSQVYRYEPATGGVQVVADGFVAPNGIEFSPDFEHVYITDTGSNTHPGETDVANPATIYRFDIDREGRHLQNKRLFAYADRGSPDGIHTDTKGNVYSALGEAGDGIDVWNREGVLLGKFLVAGAVSNFAFVPEGIYIFSGTKLHKVQIKAEGRTVRRDFGREAS